MTWIDTIDEDGAEGLLKSIYESEMEEVGVFGNIHKAMSLNPKALQWRILLYKQILRKDSPLSLAQREMIATVVSRVNDCHY